MQYRLLEILLRWTTTTLSARTLAERGWPDGPSPSQDKIRQQMQQLRQRLKEVGAPADFITMVPRQGYQLNPRYGDGAAGFLGEPPTIGALEGAAGKPELHHSEAHRAFLAEMAKDFSWLSTAPEIMQRVGEKVGHYLAITNCVFVEIDEAQNQAVVQYTWHTDEMPDVTGTYRISDFITEDFRRTAREGHPVVIHDTQNDGRIDGQRYAAFNIHTSVTVPFHRQGVWKYLFMVNAALARYWHSDEVQLIQEVANLTFLRLERAYAEQALQASEAKYRTLFNEMDEGYCIAEILFNGEGKPIDYRMVEANPRFEQLTALSLEVALSGRTMRDIAPELEEYWYEIYGHVALTGESTRFEQQVRHWGRWYDVYAFRIGAPENR
ncbi:multi-sensor signal transduction histidine kinase [Leptolyngbya sp. BL0902]|nr:multi-sensor signal transduction histidine kinase [Leptolyngbya sp. BL0902]